MQRPKPNSPLTLMRFHAPTARSIVSPLLPGLPHPIRAASRFSQPLSGFLLTTPCGLVSCHWHSWGSPCRVFPSEAAPSSRRALVALHTAAPDTAHNRRHVCAQIVERYLPESRCGSIDTQSARCKSAPKSVRILTQCYPGQAADTLLGWFAFQGHNLRAPTPESHPRKKHAIPANRYNSVKPGIKANRLVAPEGAITCRP
jgi:hypothetical protein